MFISIEGIEGGGKSTLRCALSSFLRSEYAREVVETREPGATVFGKKIRELLLEEGRPEPLTELLLFAADRAQHVEEIIRPALSRDAVVISDRYVHSTIAYQGAGRGLDRGLLEQLNRLATAGVMPDIVFLLDLEPEEGLSRARDRQVGWNRFEEEKLEFHRRVREAYLEMVDGKTMVKLDASQSAQKVAAQAVEHLQGLITA